MTSAGVSEPGCRFVVLVSGSGTNLQAILDGCGAGTIAGEVSLVISNKAGVRALERATAAGVPTTVIRHEEHGSREAFDEALVAAIRGTGADWIVLAGFMRILTPVFVEAFPGRIINIHPSLLPAFPGVRAQRQAFDYGVKVAGCTVHLVDAGVDTGPIIAQRSVPVLDDDTADSLAARILNEEHAVLVEVLAAAAAGRLRVTTPPGGRARVAHYRPS